MVVSCIPLQEDTCGSVCAAQYASLPPWDQVRAALHADALSKALVAPVEPRDVLSAGACVASFDLAAMAPADVDFTAPFDLRGAAGRAGGASAASAPTSVDDQVRLAARTHGRPITAATLHAPL